MINIIATIILCLWVLQGAHLTRMTWNGGYSLVWVGVTGLMTAALTIPLFAIWS